MFDLHQMQSWRHVPGFTWNRCWQPSVGFSFNVTQQFYSTSEWWQRINVFCLFGESGIPARAVRSRAALPSQSWVFAQISPGGFKTHTRFTWTLGRSQSESAVMEWSTGPQRGRVALYRHVSIFALNGKFISLRHVTLWLKHIILI